jgi:hypothetical protein
MIASIHVIDMFASKPKEQFVFKVDDFDSLDTIVDSLSEQTCNGKIR